ncbi:MAG: LysM peptidoglycan-binding domain-containing protein [Patescibacteria group bacterium]
MSVLKQHLRTIINRFKIDIKRINKRLLAAAVILFGLSFALINPVKGGQEIIFFFLNPRLVDIIEQPQNEIPYVPEFFFNNGASLSANTLASLIQETDNSQQPQNNSFSTEANLMTFRQNALLSQANPITTISQNPREEIINYLVQDGDTPSSIAASFGISLNTLLWANNLKETSLIRPGDEFMILPINSLIHRVKDGDTVDAIATKYKANIEKIIAFNDLPADGAIQISQKLIIPDGQMPIVQTSVSKVVKQTYTTGPGTGKSRSFPYGQCTWYIAQKRIVTWSGHAKAWLANARAAGYQTGATPQIGAIMVMTEGGWLGRLYGHVAYVESINGNWVTISEMNYNCYACKSVRTLNVNDNRIRGYIY